MHLHEKGRKDYVKELKKQKEKEMNEVKNAKKPKKENQTLINVIIKKFNKLIKGTDETLFIKGITS